MRRWANRRTVLGGLAASALAAPARAAGGARIVVIGGGFGGASAARMLARSGLTVSLVEPSATYACCPSSNPVLVGLRPMSAQIFGYEGVRRAGVSVVQDTALAIDGAARTVRLAGGASLPYDRLIVSPGIAMRFDAIPGYDAAAAERIPHAWQAGAQTELLRAQLAGLEDGGLVVVTAPAGPYRCPPGPYERASLIAWYLKTYKPYSKVILLDAKNSFSKQHLFQAAWAAHYPDHLEWVPAAKGGTLLAVEAGERVLRAEAGTFRAAVANVIPPQQAPAICRDSGIGDASGWCPIDPVTFESRLVPGVHVIGDAAIAGAMPKSAFSANAQATVCAQAVIDLLAGRAPQTPKLINTCYSLVAPDRAVSIADVYEIEWGRLVAIPEAGGFSPEDAPDTVRAEEAAFGEAWFRTATHDIFG